MEFKITEVRIQRGSYLVVLQGEKAPVAAEFTVKLSTYRRWEKKKQHKTIEELATEAKGQITAFCKEALKS